MDLEPIRAVIEAATGISPAGLPEPIGGGCIHQAFRLGEAFVKVNHASKLPLFEAEQLALREIAATGTIRVPNPLGCGLTATEAFLVLEFLPLEGSSGQSSEELGRRLAALHRTTQEQCGWQADNFIGETPQPNPAMPSWIEFFREHRLRHMLTLAVGRGYEMEHAGRLLDRVDSFFPGGEPAPSLLHGDLWSGNAGTLPDGTPVIFDPASYFGHRETDLAMAALFGGFSPAFYGAYAEEWPLDEGPPRAPDPLQALPPPQSRDPLRRKLSTAGPRYD